VNLLPDAVEFVKTMKKAAVEAVEATKPVYVYFGEVIATSPLKINVEQKMLLGEAQLILSRNVTDFNTDMTVNHTTGSHTHTHTITDTFTGGGSASDNTHNHTYSGRKTFTVHNGLVVGDEVILIRQQEGQKFIVWDRIGT